MIALQELENEVKNLPKQDFSQFRNWFLDYENNKWDKEIEEDIYSGKLDDIMNNAKKDFQNGKYETL